MDEFNTGLFRLINSNHNEIIDFIMWWASDRFVWIPLYAFILFYFAKQYQSQWWKIIIALAVMILASDQGANFFKAVIPQLRPCHDLRFSRMVHLVNNYCGGQYGFVSSHASNSAAVVVFTFLMLRVPGWLKLTLPFYCFIICYSRVYLAAHFPFDVLRGVLLGCLAGILAALILKKVFGLKNHFSEADQHIK